MRTLLSPAAAGLFCAALLSFSATAAIAAEPQTAQFKFATQTLTVPAGFTVELVAGPPMVNRPISIAFDEQGGLYATDSSGLSDRAPVQFEQKPHRVVRLADADGDGRFEQSTVFAEKMMFPQGALFYEGSLYVGAPPHIWKLTDKNGDGVSDERVEWYDGKTLTGCANDLHGPYLGLDGRIYWTKGAAAEQQHTIMNTKTLVSRAAHIMRSKADGTDREIMLTGGMDNPVGVTFSATGDRILSGTFFQIGTPGKRDGLIHAIWGGVYGKDQPSIVGHTRTGDLMPIMTHMGAAAPCGSTTYRSRVFGQDYTDNLFVCYFNLRKISRHQLVPDGATYKTIDTDFITSDSLDFHPTDVLEDADGSLLVVDTGGWYKICCPTSQLAKPDVLGGIYRIRKTGAPRLGDPRGTKLPWATMAAPELARLLADERPYVAERAIHLLGKKGEPAVAAITGHGLGSSSIATRRNALWALARIDTAAARHAVRTTLARDPSTADVALQVTSLLRDAAATDALQPFLAGNNLAHARLAAEALGRIGATGSVDALLAATKHLRATQFTATGTPLDAAERILEHSLIYALIEIGARDVLRAKLSSARDPRLLRVLVVALDQMAGDALQPADIIGWLDSKEAVLKRTAGWVVNNHPDWGDALATFFHGRLAAKTRSASDGTELQTQLASLAKSNGIQSLLATTAGDAAMSRETRLLALRAMAGAGVKETPAAWFTQLAQLLQRPGQDQEIARQAVITARGLPLPKGGHPELAAALARAGRDAALPVDVRLDALVATTPAAIAAVEPELFAFLTTQLSAKQNTMPVRGAAAAVLAKAPLSPEQQLALADTMKSVGPLEAARVLPAFEKKPTEALGLRVVAALRQSPGLAGIRANNLRPVFAKYSPTVQQKAEELVTLVNADTARQNARVDELLPAMKDGDIRRGQALFQSAKAACSLCHTVGYLGGRLGPDLTGIGKIRNERELIEAIIYPSATFVRGYEPMVVTLKNGEAHSGILKKDAPDEVVLATGPESEQRVPRSDIKDIEPGPVSPMPPGMDVILTKQELADLVAFMKSRI